MPNQKETMISGLSYTNKDFNTIYSELLDLVKTLTNKWDPSISNESDPGVVLIKLGALLADKNNYNIDKNILELFPLSVSQYGNARKIYDIAGYAMKWYQSASTELTFTYTGNETLDGNVINIKKYDTMVSNEDGDLVYTLIEDVVLSSTDRTKVGIALQGVIKNYEVNGVDVIKLDNLDDNNRIYFNERMIAENGIFISSASQDNFISDWERVDTLQTRELNAKIFKFGVTPDSDTCYIEFPQDIANLIGSGLKIKYIVSSGVQGNVSSGTITSLYSNDIIVSVNGEELNLSDSISITNVYAATNGKDPETLDEAYDNFKDTIGTFNTLVTCKDYETAANDLYNTATKNYMQSNCVVSDRTNDIVSSTYVITLSADGTRRQVVNTPGGFDAFTIGLYALEPMNSINSAYYYNKSFSVNQDSQSIKDELENYKSIQHDWFDTTPNPSRKYIYKNFYKISGNISTYDKVSTTEATEIKNNVMAALYEKYNARNIDFGIEIPFDDIVSTIENADTRIKYVVLNQPEYTLRYMLSDDFTGSFDSSRGLSVDDLETLLAKMILSGSVQLYNFDKSVNYAYGQTATNTYSEIESITTSVSVPATAVTDEAGYTVKANENIQLFATNLISTMQYTAYVNYCLEGDGWKEGNGWSKYDKNTYVALNNDMRIIFNWVDSNNSEQTSPPYNSGIIKCSFELDSNPDLFTITKGGKNYRMLEGDEAIDIMSPNETVFRDTTVDCLWFLKNGEVSEQDGNSQVTYTLFTEGQSERILENNEYFMYTNKDRNSLVILTSGTKLIRDKSDTSISVTNSLNAGAVVSDGISAVGRNDWFNWNAADGMQGSLTVRELQIVTLGEGARLQGTVKGDITNTPIKITGAQYSETSSGPLTPLPVFSGVVDGWDLDWYVRSRLNLNTSPSIPQSLQGNQTVTVKFVDNDETETIQGKDILSSIPLSLAGGESVDVTALMEDGSRQAVLQLYSYTPSPSKVHDNINDKEIQPQGEYYILSAGQEQEPSQSYTITFDFKEKQHYLIPVIKPTNNNVVTFSSTGDGSCYLYNGGDLDSTPDPIIDKISAAGSYILHVKGACSEITVTWSKNGESAYVPDDIINFGMIKKVGSSETATDRYSNDFTQTVARNGLSATNVLAKITDLVTDDKVTFDYTYEVDPADTISTVSLDTYNQGNVLDPRAVWDINHVCNKFTIAQLNIRNTNISVASSSIK